MRVRKLIVAFVAVISGVVSLATVTTSQVHAEAVQAVKSWVPAEFEYSQSGSSSGDATQDIVITKPGYWHYVLADSSDGKKAIASGQSVVTVDSSQLNKALPDNNTGVTNVTNNTNTSNANNSNTSSSYVGTEIIYQARASRKNRSFNRHGRYYYGYIQRNAITRLYKNSRHIYRVRGKRCYRIGADRYVLAKNYKINKIYVHVSK